MNKDLEWIRNFIFGDADNEPMLTYYPKMNEVDIHINLIQSELAMRDEVISEAIELINEGRSSLFENYYKIWIDRARKFLIKHNNQINAIKE
jgi:hypothetical protein